MAEGTIFQIRRMGHVAQVSAIDPATLTEVSLQGPANMPDFSLHRLAAQKLARALERRVAAGRR